MPVSHLVRVPSNNGIRYFCRNMHIFNVTFLAVLGSITMIGATAIRNPARASPLCTVELKEYYQEYVALQQLMEFLTQLKSFLQVYR